jgi:hypothetical protein
MGRWKGWIVAGVIILLGNLFGVWIADSRVARPGWVYHLPPPDRSSVEDHALRVTVESVRRDGDQVIVAFTLQWISGKAAYSFTRPWTLVEIRFWGIDGEDLGTSSTNVLIDKAFLTDESNLFARDLTFDLPNRAASVSVGLVEVGLMTGKVGIAPR